MKLDEKDVKILHAIATDKTDSPEEIEKATGIPKSTVHYRIRQLRDDGIIEDELNNVNLDAIGLSITLISEVWAEYGEDYHEEVGEKLGDIEGVNQVYFTLGDTDFIVVSHLTSRPQIERLVERFEEIDEIQRTSSKFVITTLKNEPHPLADFNESTLLELLGE